MHVCVCVCVRACKHVHVWMHVCIPSVRVENGCTRSQADMSKPLLDGISRNRINICENEL